MKPKTFLAHSVRQKWHPIEQYLANAEEVINVCGSEKFTVVFEVNMNTDAGAECNDTDVFQFIPPPARRLSQRVFFCNTSFKNRWQRVLVTCSSIQILLLCSQGTHVRLTSVIININGVYVVQAKTTVSTPSAINWTWFSIWLRTAKYALTNQSTRSFADWLLS